MEEKKRSTLEERLKEHEEKTKYTISEVLKHPLKYSQGGFWEAWDELYANIYPCVKRPKTKSGSTGQLFALNGGLFTFFGMWAVPHELIHAGVNSLSGGVNKEIVLNSLYGGGVINYFFPEIQSKLMLPFIGGYVRTNNDSDLAMVAINLAPYVLTPIGLYIANKGKEKKNVVVALSGTALVAGHLGGIFGDFWNVGRIAVHQGLDLFYSIFGQELPQNVEEWSNTAVLAWTIGGFYLGAKAMSYTYRLCKGGFNSFMHSKKSHA